MSENGTRRQVRLVFADEGTFHAELVSVAAERLASYERLVDLLREEPDVTRNLYVDMRRLVSASLVED
jgi:predicted DNA-binding ribbon-helix-helix protein